MIKKQSIGTILFVILFLYLACQIAAYPIGIALTYSPTLKENTPQIVYSGLKRRIELIQKDEVKYKDQLIRSGKASEFDQNFHELKSEAERFKQKHLIQGVLLPQDQIVVLIGSLTAILYLLAGIGLLMHFLWARRIVLGSVCSSVIFYLSVLFQVYWITNYSQELNSKYNALDLLLKPPTEPIHLPHNDIFNMVFFSPMSWLGHFVLFIYVVSVFYYFNQPKIKERF